MPQFVVIGWDGPDGAQQRDEHREEHVAYISNLDRQGRVILAGPIRSDTDDKSIGVVVVLEAADLDEARRVAGRDPYVSAGVFQSLTVNPFKQVFPQQP